MQITMSAPDITSAEIEAVNQVLHTPVLAIGPQTESFERSTAEFVGAHHAVAVSSGTAGLHLAVIAAGVKDGDQVITSPFSFVASANVILYERAEPVFVDVDLRTGNIDATCIEAAITSRTKAILVVHAFGQPAEMNSILQIARQHHLRVIEDACEAIGAEYRGRKVGVLGDAGVFAFYPNKQMTTGEGGMIVTDDEQWSHLFRSLRNQGRDVFDGWLNHSRLGYNYRLDEMSAALGRVQMGRIQELLEKRDRVARWYNERLANLELVETPYITATTTCMSWFVYVVKIKPPADRAEVMRKLGETGIPSRPYFTPIHLQPFYREKFGYARGDFARTEYLGDVSLALPFSSVMTEEQVQFVCDNLARIVQF